jgi:hypothetical protein
MGFAGDSLSAFFTFPVSSEMSKIKREKKKE